MNNTEQQFLKSLDDKLWKAADKLRANLDAANYKHVVLGLIFLKYVSDAFEERQEQLLELFQTNHDDNIYYLPREDFDSDADYRLFAFKGVEKIWPAGKMSGNLENVSSHKSSAKRPAACKPLCFTVGLWDCGTVGAHLMRDELL